MFELLDAMKKENNDLRSVLVAIAESHGGEIHVSREHLFQADGAKLGIIKNDDGSIIVTSTPLESMLRKVLKRPRDTKVVLVEPNMRKVIHLIDDDYGVDNPARMVSYIEIMLYEHLDSPTLGSWRMAYCEQLNTIFASEIERPTTMNHA